jgi:hypothetical protein
VAAVYHAVEGGTDDDYRKHGESDLNGARRRTIPGREDADASHNGPRADADDIRSCAQCTAGVKRVAKHRLPTSAGALPAAPLVTAIMEGTGRTDVRYTYLTGGVAVHVGVKPAR